MPDPGALPKPSPIKAHPKLHKRIHKTKHDLRRADGGRKARLQKRLGKLKGRAYDYHNPIPKPKAMPAPPPPEAPPPTPLPWNAAHETNVSGLNRNFDTTNASLLAQEQSVKNQYGLDDSTNPFSRAALLQQSYQQSQNRTLNSFAGRGQLYSGALSAANSQNRMGFEQNYNQLSGQYAQELQDIGSRRLRATQERDEGIVQSEAKRLQDALSERPDPSEAPEAPPPPVDPNTALLAQIRALHKKARKAKGPQPRRKLQRRERKLRSRIVNY